MPQNWRAVAISYYNSVHLLRLDDSPENVKKHYVECFHDLLAYDEQLSINKVILQKWKGKILGNWQYVSTLQVPKVKRKFGNPLDKV